MGYRWIKVLGDENHTRCLTDSGVFMEAFLHEDEAEPFVCLVHGNRDKEDGGDTFQYLGWQTSLEGAQRLAEGVAEELEANGATERGYGYAD